MKAGKNKGSFEGFGGVDQIEEEAGFVSNHNYEEDDDQELTDYERQALAQFK